MKLEQTIKHSKKSQSGIIWHTSKEAYKTEWELVYHKVLHITSGYTKLTNIKSRYSEMELPLHHKLSGNIHIQFNEAVAKVTTYISQPNNPYLLEIH